jgi:hypothetical protein
VSIAALKENECVKVLKKSWISELKHGKHCLIPGKCSIK